MAILRIGQGQSKRTALAQEAAWPVRVDLQLEEGLGEQHVDRWVPSACVLCSHGCGLDVAVRDGRIVGVRGRVNRGRLGPKGLFGCQANNATDRLLRPLIRRDGELVETDWDTALGTVAERSRQLLATGRTGYHFHTRTKTGRSPRLQEAAPDVWIELSTEDAAALGIGEGDLVRADPDRLGPGLQAALLQGRRRPAGPGGTGRPARGRARRLPHVPPAGLPVPGPRRAAAAVRRALRLWESFMGMVRRKNAELLGRSKETGLLLLRDLRQLYLMAAEAEINWWLVRGARWRPGTTMAQLFETCHEETWNQLKWIKTKVKEVSAQVLVGG